MNTEKVIFIGGSGRCGSTLLAELLDFHPKIASIFEVHSFAFLLKHIRNNSVPGIYLLRDQFETIHRALLPETEYNWRLTEEEAVFAWEKKIIEPLQSGESLVNATRKWIDFLHTLQMIRDGSCYVVHKTPVLALYLPEIKLLFPESFFIHIVRRPQDVILSYLEQNWGPANLKEGIDWYCERVDAFIKQKDEFHNCIEIRFEDLILQPSRILDQIQETTGIENDTQSILDYNLIDVKKRDHRINQISAQDSDYIYNEIKKRLPYIAEIYSN
jgi:hypothetical protein